ncbi:hypothetical protein RDMS_09030 [Deinococcus sp. RL]|uniref:hypothetical protein n=1 Tax=Deinococcus sp. RL TaxID=1489678 RepID=UPI0004D78357|nr:hypothetical protein [Deinococcus sp. RL]KEF34101.1 hypothetical protein RDMS_09030 [Deinococcus sp. RL]
MANFDADPLKARIAQRRKRKAGSLKDVTGMLWEALETARELLREDDVQVKLKAIHALSQTASSYSRVYEVGELEARLEALEAAQEAQVKHAARGAA